MTTTYWDVGRRIVEGEQSGGKRAGYGRELLKRLSFASWRSRVSSPAGFYEAEALRGGWSVRQLDRQVGSQFYERTALSRNKAAMLRKGSDARPEDVVSPEEEIKDPFVLKFLGLRDEYSES